MAKKTTAKSVRFNVKHLDWAFKKTGIQKEQELIDCILEELYELEHPKSKHFITDIYSHQSEPAGTTFNATQNVSVNKPSILDRINEKKKQFLDNDKK